MHIQLLSDLHLEENPGFQPSPAPGADLLVLAGDIGSYQRGSALPGLGDEDFGLGRFAHWPVPVLVVPGNHEYDGLDFDAAHARLQATCERLGLRWLERTTRVIGGVRFVGTTLWADFDGVASLAPTPEARLQGREKAFRAANHYLRHAATTRGGQPFVAGPPQDEGAPSGGSAPREAGERGGQLFLAEQMREESLRCQQWLRAALAEPFDGPTVAVTHFAPSLRSADPRYGLTPGTAGFCNALDDLLPLADLWLHGHLHCAIDWRAGRCRVVANPLGYADKGEQAAFRPHGVVEVPAAGPLS
ncbi:metallophosphoesterase [Ottowia sp.]|uniref:metallophosphoesterase n=1 Tax=Ottowia sp. TaxID=1898956 RepID=UPI0039E5AED8